VTHGQGYQAAQSVQIAYDITKPSLPQVGSYAGGGRPNTMLSQQSLLATGNALQLIDAQRPAYMRATGSYQGYGFNVPGSSAGKAALATTLSNVTRKANLKCGNAEERLNRYHGIYDARRLSDIALYNPMGI